MRTANDNHKPDHVLLVEELPDGREVAVRAPLPQVGPMTGPARGAYEEWRERFAAEVGRYLCVYPGDDVAKGAA